VLYRRVKRLEEAIGVVRGAMSEEGIHDVRVAARRLAAALDLLEGLGSDGIQEARRALRRLRNQLNGARDAEVALRQISGGHSLACLHRTSGPELARARHVLQAKVEKDRVKASAKVARRADKVAGMCDALVLPAELDDAHHALLLARLGRRARRAVACAERVASRRTLGSLHQLRVAFKHVRYATEVAVELKLKPEDPELETALRVLQDALGAVMDARLTAATLRKFQKDSPVAQTLREYADYRGRLLADAITSWVHGTRASRLVGHDLRHAEFLDTPPAR
jgi:CHAD domain-containing protein